MDYQAVEGRLRWLGGRWFWIGVAALGLILTAGIVLESVRVSGRRADPQEAFLFTQAELQPGVPSPVRIFVRDGLSALPVAGARIELELVDEGGQAAWRGEARTDAGGLAAVAPLPPADSPAGTFQLKARVESDKGRSELAQAIEIQRGVRLMISTDKPLYQPGQVIHMRVLALNAIDLRPARGQALELEVADPKGNKVLRKRLTSSDYGIAAADFRLAELVNLGEYRITAELGDDSAERAVRVDRYRLPRFKVEVETERPAYLPGERVKGSVLARYTFGKPVAGAQIEVSASDFIEKLEPFARIEGRTDEQGRFGFELPLKKHFAGSASKQGDAAVQLVARVVDLAGHEQKGALELTVSAQPIRVQVFPESGKLVRNVENRIYLLATYPDGRPAACKLTVTPPGWSVQASETGLAEIALKPVTNGLPVEVVAEDVRGARAVYKTVLDVDRHCETFLLRTDKAILRSGETLELSVLSPWRSGQVFIDVIKQRRCVLSDVLEVVDGQARKQLSIPPDLFGTLEIHAWRIMSDGQLVANTKVVQVSPADDLSIQAVLDKQVYKPGETAVLDLAVSGKDGQPVQAALGLAGVDEAVFALQEARPGLERVYFLMQQELLEPRYELCAHVPLRFDQAASPPAAIDAGVQKAGQVLFSAVEAPSVPARAASRSFDEKNARFRQEEEAYYDALVSWLGILPMSLCLLLCLPIALYAFWRLLRPRYVEEFEGADLDDFRRFSRRISLWWVLGLYVPAAGGLLAAFLAQLLLSRRHREIATLVVIAGLVLWIAVELFVWTWRFRRNPASGAVPALRKALTAMPAAYLLGMVGFAGLVVADEANGLPAEDLVLAVLGISGAVFLLLGLGWISVATRGALAALSAGRWLWCFFGRSILAGIPLLLLFMGLVLTAGGMAASGAKALAGMEMGDGLVKSTEAAPAPGGVADGLKAPQRVRRHFPETLLWKPELITDAAGKARLEIPLADSITTWRLAASAVSAAGRLGAGTWGMRVFQDFFVDIDFPVALTRHDRVSLPVAVFNYLDRPQTVRLELQRDGWFRLLGPAAQTLQLAPGEISALRFSIEALKVGRHSLTVKAFGSEMADAVERSVEVEPDGETMELSWSGRLEGAVAQDFEVPAGAIEGASRMLVRLYPGMFSQVVGGIDSLIRLPGG
ncbi:MAG: hypothetical protein JXR96_20400 [Deltaproteobacteria bacterium]|nr:hypothetical protein [Deltaproteobacteria bacterium]